MWPQMRQPPDLTEDDFLDPEQVIQIEYEPVRIDILTSIAGCSFSDTWESRITVRYGSVDAFFIGKQAQAGSGGLGAPGRF